MTEEELKYPPSSSYFVTNFMLCRPPSPLFSRFLQLNHEHFTRRSAQICLRGLSELALCRRIVYRQN